MKEQNAVGFLVAKVHQLSGRIFTKLLKNHQIEINPAQGRIMFVLWREDNITIRKLAKRTSLGKSTLTPMLDRLEDMGYIKRVPSNSDRREILIQLTEKDRNLQNKYVQVSQEMTKLSFDNFTIEEINQLESYLQRLFENLQNHESK